MTRECCGNVCFRVEGGRVIRGVQRRVGDKYKQLPFWRRNVPVVGVVNGVGGDDRFTHI